MNEVYKVETRDIEITPAKQSALAEEIQPSNETSDQLI